jgi:hypothetical protein
MSKEIVLGRGGFLEVAFEESPHAAPEAGLLLVGAEDAGEIFDLDHEGAKKAEAAGLAKVR